MTENQTWTTFIQRAGGREVDDHAGFAASQSLTSGVLWEAWSYTTRCGSRPGKALANERAELLTEVARLQGTGDSDVAGGNLHRRKQGGRAAEDVVG